MTRSGALDRAPEAPTPLTLQIYGSATTSVSLVGRVEVELGCLWSKIHRQEVTQSQAELVVGRFTSRPTSRLLGQLQEVDSMVPSDRIRQYGQRLPPSLQAEVLDFVEYRVAKAEQEMSLQQRKE